MQWIYLSPHLDDAALSCGALIHSQTNRGDRVQVWTLCAGDPPQEDLSAFARSLHERWGVGRQAVAGRREEDRLACERLGALYLHMHVPDCIYRQGPGGEFLYASEQAIFGELAAQEAELVHSLTEALRRRLLPEAQLVCPLTLGNHVDHQLTRRAAQGLGRDLWYYADYPYVVKERARIEDLLPPGCQPQIYPVGESDFRAWEQSVAAYASQVSTFWPDPASMHLALKTYLESWPGAVLWRP